MTAILLLALGQSGGARVIVDADTANEIDDLYAIVRVLSEPGLRVEGLTSAQWHGRGKGPADSADRSQTLNEDLLRLLGLERIPHPRGAREPMTDPKTPRDSPAARLIIERAKALPDDEPLTVVVLGSFTNLASAVLLDPGIAPRIRARVIGLTYEPDRGVGRKEFNADNDQAAVDALLSRTDLDLAVMTATASRPMVYERAEVDRRLAGKGGAWDYLVARWEEHAKEKRTWTMWDIALVEALLRPRLATLEEVDAPAGAGPAKLRVYTKIDVPGMQADFWSALGRKINP